MLIGRECYITTVECIQDVSKTYLNLTLQVQNITLQEATDKFECLNCCLVIVLFVWKYFSFSSHFIIITLILVIWAIILSVPYGCLCTNSLAIQHNYDKVRPNTTGRKTSTTHPIIDDRKQQNYQHRHLQHQKADRQ